MWHLKTKMGTFWIIESEEPENRHFFYGLDDDALGSHQQLNEVLDDICTQSTGSLLWDGASNVTAPHDIAQWVDGEPESWK